MDTSRLATLEALAASHGVSYEVGPGRLSLVESYTLLDIRTGVITAHDEHVDASHWTVSQMMGWLGY